MKALIYKGPWRMEMQDLPVPEPGRGEVLLRSVAVGICGSDVHGFTGESGRRKPGMVMGHEAVGEVVELGKDTQHLQVGDRVAVFNIVACKRCRHCVAGKEQLCSEKVILGVNAGTRGAMAEYFTFPESGLYKLKPDCDPCVGILTEPIAVGLHAVDHMLPSKEDTVVIIGAGTIGIGLAIALQARGVESVYAVDKLADKLDMVRRFGAQGIHTPEQDPTKFIHERTNGYGAAGVFEAVGLNATVQCGYALCASGGTMVLVGNLDKEIRLPLQDLTSREISVRGSYGFTRKDFAEAVSIVSRGDCPLHQLISGTCSLEETENVMKKMASGELQSIKMVIKL